MLGRSRASRKEAADSQVMPFEPGFQQCLRRKLDPKHILKAEFIGFPDTFSVRNEGNGGIKEDVQGFASPCRGVWVETDRRDGLGGMKAVCEHVGCGMALSIHRGMCMCPMCALLGNGVCGSGDV